jgi:hypothetical protein
LGKVLGIDQLEKQEENQRMAPRWVSEEQEVFRIGIGLNRIAGFEILDTACFFKILCKFLITDTEPEPL